MGLDIRLPIGLLFTLLTVLLVPTGLVNDTALNVWTGAAMLAFGVPMLALGWRGQRRIAREESAAPTEVQHEPSVDVVLEEAA